MTDTVTTATPKKTETPKPTMGRTTAIVLALAALLLGGAGGYYYGTIDSWWKWPSMETIEAGNGKSAEDAYAVLVEMQGKIKDGETVLPKAPFPVPVSYEELADQFKLGALVTEIKKMKEGGTYKVTLPPAALSDLEGPLEGKALVFDVKLVKVLDKAGYEAERNALIQKANAMQGVAQQGAAAGSGAEATKTPETAKEPAKK